MSMSNVEQATITNIERKGDGEVATAELKSREKVYNTEINLSEYNFTDHLIDEKSVGSIEGLEGEKVFIRRTNENHVVVDSKNPMVFESEKDENFRDITISLGAMILSMVSTPILLYNRLYLLGGFTLVVFLSSIIYLLISEKNV